MDRKSSSLPNISVKKPSKEYSLKKAQEPIGSSSDEEYSKKLTIEKEKISLINADELRPYDVLCGRDKATFNNVGNRRFRYSISMNIPRYDAARTKAEKAAVIKYICDLFRDEVGVRFLKKHKSGDGYMELNGSEARKKVGHALRDMSVARQQLNQKRWSSMLQNDSQKKRISIRSNNSNAARRPDFDSCLLEPLPIDEQQKNQKVQPRYEQSRSNPFHSNINLAKEPNYDRNQVQANHSQQSFYPSQQHVQKQEQQQEQGREIMQQQQQEQMQQNDLQQTLIRLQQQQLQLHEERERLLKQHERQQQLQEQLQEQQEQMHLQRNLQRQQQQLQQLQQQQQQERRRRRRRRQQEQQNHFFQDDESNEHDVLNAMPFHRIRRDPR